MTAYVSARSQRSTPKAIPESTPAIPPQAVLGPLLTSLRSRSLSPFILATTTGLRFGIKSTIPGQAIPPAVVQQFRQSSAKKALLTEMVAQARAAGSESEQVKALIYRDGYCVVRCSVLDGAQVIFARNAGTAQAGIPIGIKNACIASGGAVYTWNELVELVRIKQASPEGMEPEALRALHAVKRELGGKIITAFGSGEKEDG